MLFRNKLQYFLVRKLHISNKAALNLIKSGKISVNGEVVDENKVLNKRHEVCYEGRPLRSGINLLYLVFYKPRGIETTLNKTIPNGLHTLLKFPEYLFPVGRLDKDSEGLLLLTNDGTLAYHITSPSGYHEKEYEVEVDAELNKAFLNNMCEGMFIGGRKTRPARVQQTGPYTFSIILTEGMNRQIRRMCDAQGYSVISLKRSRIVTIQLNGIKPGDFRKLNDKELEQLYASLNLKK